MSDITRISGEYFYAITLVEQRKKVYEMIKEKLNSGDSVVEFPFRLYPKIQEELKENEWLVDEYTVPGRAKKFSCCYPNIRLMEYNKKKEAAVIS